MKRAAVLGIFALVVGAASWTAQGPLPGDVAITRTLQTLLGDAPPWAFALTQSALVPLAGVSVGVAALLGWWLRGAVGGAAAVLAYGLALVADKALRAGLFVARPAEPLVAVAAPSSSSGLPSTFGLVYGAVFGVALLTAANTARQQWPARAIAAGAILVGSAARVVLGGHWASQMAASVTTGLLLAGLAIRLCAALPALNAGTRG